MAQSDFIKFFNTRGEDMNFISATSSFGLEYTGKLFFPRVSVNLIESNQIFVLQEITNFSAEPQLRKLQGQVEVFGANPNILGYNTTFESSLVGATGGTTGDVIQIENTRFTVNTIYTDTDLTVASPLPSKNIEKTENFYLVDFVGYNKPVSYVDTDSQELIAEFSEESGSFFFYDINYSEKVPYIEKKRSLSIELEDGTAYSLDPRNGRLIINASDNQIDPIQVNLGFSSETEGIFEETLTFSFRKSKLFELDTSTLPSQQDDGTWIARIPYVGYTAEFEATDKLYLARDYGSGKYQYFELTVLDIEEIPGVGMDITVKENSSSIFSTIGAGNISNFGLNLYWKETLLNLGLYAEAESEDERFRLTLENFGRKIDEDKEYIFRESNINEELIDYMLLNKKRKELLLEGDKIYPYMGSYKALINVLNLFGYYDVEIKEYFLNVDDSSLDKGKFLAIPIAKSSEQKKIIKRVWELLPSKIFKKTSLFGLYYKLNKESGEYDEYGIPIVTEDYQFSPEEVLVKLFGLKELLKKDYLPLNARIYDITGEGIYFERYNFETWNDTVDVRVLDIGKRPNVIIYPEPVSYIRDLRRIDQYYVEKFQSLGYQGFLGPSATYPDIIIEDNTDAYTGYDGPIKAPTLVATSGIETYTIVSGEVTELGTTSIDGVLLTVGDRIFVKNAPASSGLGSTSETNQPANGIYIVTGVTSSTAISRSSDADSSSEFTSGMLIFVSSGNFYSGKSYQMSTTGTITLNTTPLEFEEITQEEALAKAYVGASYVPSYLFGSISEISDYYVGSFSDYNSGKWSYRDYTWDTMPPGIYDSEFNVKASYLKPLPDDPNAIFPVGAPALIETLFELYWDECTFSWDQCSTLNSFLATFSATGSTVTVTDYYSINIQSRGFSNGDTVTIANCSFAGNYPITNVAGNTFQISISETLELSTGRLTYSTDISQISTSFNRLSWDTIGRGEYLDMRVLVEKYDSQSFVYDTGRKTIDSFSEQYLDPTTGLTYMRILDAVVLPYQGIYDVSVYIFDSTNNFTMQYKKYEAVTPTAEITASYQKQEIYDDWDNLSSKKWNDVTFDWYYPAESVSSWEEADLQWDSLQTYTYLDQDLKENKTLVDIVEIDRVQEYVVIQGDYIDSEYAKPGDYLYFERKSNKLELENYELTAASIGLTGGSSGVIDFYFSYGGTAIQPYSRILLKKTDTPFYQLNSSDFFYADVISISGSTITMRGPEFYVSTFSSYWNSNSVFLDGGVYSGTYAIEILSAKELNNNTVFYLNDSAKELYKLDGYFQPYLTSYDVDYAETHIGADANDYDSLKDVDWNNLREKSWWSEERHSTANSGFLITDVAANGKIQIGDYSPFFFSGDGALNSGEIESMQYAVIELNNSKNEGIAKFEYEMYPVLQPRNVRTISGVDMYVDGYIPLGSTSINLKPYLGATGPAPWSIKIPAEIQVSVAGGTVSASLISSGCGYDRAPLVTLSGATGATAAEISVTIDAEGKVNSVVVTNPGSGYSLAPVATVEVPYDSVEHLTDTIWTGYEWKKIASVNGCTVYFEEETSSPISDLYQVAMPYNFHRQIIQNAPKKLKDFYYFILASSKTPGLQSLYEIKFDKGVEGEWYNHPQRSFSYPLKNTLLFYIDGENLSQDAQWQYWLSNGKDFPVTGYNSNDSKALYAGSYYQPFSFSDAVITPYSFKIERSTSVVFHDDSSRLPMKQQRSWRIVNDETGEIEVEALSKKLSWNFSKNGKYTVSLEITDRIGNISRGIKKSFVVVE